MMSVSVCLSVCLSVMEVHWVVMHAGNRGGVISTTSRAMLTTARPSCYQCNASMVYAVALCFYVCVFSVSVRNWHHINMAAQIKLVLGIKVSINLFCKEIWELFPQKMVLSDGTLSQTMALEMLQKGLSTIANVVILDPLTPVTSLALSASTFVYTAISMMKCVLKVLMWQLKLSETQCVFIYSVHSVKDSQCSSYFRNSKE